MQPTTTMGLRILRQAGEFLIRRLDDSAVASRSEGTINSEIVEDTGPFSASKIQEQLNQAYPQHSISGQFIKTYTPKDADQSHLWEFELWDHLALLHNGHPSSVLSMVHYINQKSADAIIYNPRTEEEFTATQGHGAELNGKRIRCSPQRNLANAVIGIDWLSEAHLFEGSAWMRRLQTLAADSYKFIDNGSALYTLAQVAAGKLDGAVLSTLTPQQWSVGKLLLQESGALACNLEGQPQITPRDGIIIANPKLMKSLIKTMMRPIKAAS